MLKNRPVTLDYVESTLKQQKPTDAGCGCHTAVEHMPHDLKVMGLNPAGLFFFFFFIAIPTFHHLNQVPQGGASLCVGFECSVAWLGRNRVNKLRLGEKHRRCLALF